MECSLPGSSAKGFSRPEYWSGWLFPSTGDLTDPGIKPGSPTLQVDSLPTELSGKLTNMIIIRLKSENVLHETLCKELCIFAAVDWQA